MMDEELNPGVDSSQADSHDISGDAFIIADQHGRVVDWSIQAQRLFGWTKEEARGQLLAQLIIPEEQRDAHWTGIENYRKNGEGSIVNRNVQVTALHRSGRKLAVELTVTPTRIGDQMFFCGVVRSRHDNRPRLKVESSRKRVIDSRLFQQVTARWNAEDNFDAALKDCVDIMCSIGGWPVGHVLIRDLKANTLKSADIWHLSDSQRYHEIHEASRLHVFRKAEGFPGRIWAEGETVWSASIGEDPRFTQDDLHHLGLHGVFGFPVIADGETVSVLEFFTIEQVAPDPQLLMQVGSLSSHLARTMERRRWEKERLQLAAIVDSSYDAIFSKDINGVILTWNAGAEHVYGYTEKEAIGQPVSIIFPTGMTVEEEEIRDAMKTGRRLTMFDTTRRSKDGREIPVAITASPLKDSQGRVVGSSMIERDISERRNRERELKEAIQQAETANHMKSEFLANISHELRTPMNAIIGMLELALGEELEPVIEDYLSTARESADTLRHLLNDLLDFSRMEAGRFELEDEPFSIREIVDSTMKIMSLRANEKGLELVGRVSQSIPGRVSGDGYRLRQILINLVNNAIKFTEQGEVAVLVECQKPATGLVHLKISVRDTGIGIAPEDRDKVFQPFTQLDATTTRQHSGTGLGLAICSELIHKMDGTMSLTSQPGQGSVFSFEVTLPIVKLTAPESTVVPDLADLPVLVVDDNESNRTILEETLTAWKMRPTVLSDAQEALEVIRKANHQGEGFELVIVDALMPEMDGFTLIEKLHEEGINKSAAVLMLSSADRQTFKDRCENIPVDGFLEKPVSQSDMLDAVISVLRGTSHVREVADSIERTPRSLKILLAEDTPANQKVVKAILDKRGHKVDIADNGREAIKFHQQSDFDLILMDVQMPTMDGLQATEAIRKMSDPEKSKIPIIAMTAHARREDRQKCFQAGMDSYISKPLDARRLLKLIESSQQPSSGSTSTATAVAASTPKQNLYNRDAALLRLDGNEDLFKSLITYFLEDAPQLLEKVEMAIQSQDVPEAERAAHSLKGLAANFDADSCVSAAQNLEGLCRSAAWSQASAVLIELRDAVENLTLKLQSEL
ncbi:MAG: response regulator [Planctomycetaceae bacterium]|nr:response regulator [Planctomycetaceae bacterium]